MIKKIICLFIFISLTVTSYASHIVGSDFTYECLGNNVYQFTLSIYRDCRDESIGGGRATSIAYDNPVLITVYDGNGSLISSGEQHNAISDQVIPIDVNSDCINNIPVKCLNRLRFSFTKTLTANNAGYYLVYQRCCRNFSTQNIATPDETGVTFYCFVPPSLTYGCNTSPVFNNDPPQVICINNPLKIDNSATDTDNDSLSYQLCSAIRGAARTDSKPAVSSAPPYSSVSYNAPYSAINPMAANPQISIDPVTGLITGTPTIQGIFDIAVCCLEWRNGILMNTTRREFQVQVTNCSKIVIADIPILSQETNTYKIQCNGLSVDFINTSTGDSNYYWDFGEANISNDTSNVFQPTHTYADTGTYIVKLVVNKNSDCPDSVSRIVKVYPELNSAFTYNGLLCPDSPIDFQDQSVSTHFPIDIWSWNFDDGSNSVLQNPTHTFSNIGKNYNVQLITGNTAGCIDTTQVQLNIPKLDFFVGNDTIILKDKYLQFQGRGAQSYTWTPPTFLDNPLISNPLGFYPDTGSVRYVVNGITEEGCVVSDDIQVYIADKAYVIVPNAFSPNGDGNNDLLRIIGVGYVSLNSYKIFNRWGEMVFETTNFKEGWDGTLKGEVQPLGTYFWVIQATDLDNNKKPFRGDVTLIR